ncbi:DUF5602 domain-containing protein [Vogesella amnigena]|uniref:DUF5602 domain-containing protein n=1 Tax=Vogesella amnigena TaxID=1507449 RepID=A0ABV7TR48_9NEIS
MNTQQTSGCALRLAIACSLLLAAPWAQAAASSYSGKAVRLGKGTAHTVVRTDDAGQVASIGIVLSKRALQGLPKPGAGPTAYWLEMPARGPRTVFNHVVVNWEAAGHPPPKVYDVPHFDFHFYLGSKAEQRRVRFQSEAESADPAQQPPAELLPAGYIVPPGTAVPQMGVHAINPAGQEFNGQPFTATFIYGYHRQRLFFLEPMVTLSFLQSRPSFEAAIPQPARFDKPGSYPLAYRVQHNPANDSVEIVLMQK